MNRDQIERGKRYVTAYGRAPLKRVWNSRPSTAFGNSYDRWNKRRGEVEEQVAEKLRKDGARINLKWDRAEIAYCGFTASSTMGLDGALTNWIARADRELAK